MDLNELQQLIASLEASGLRSLELCRPGERVKLTLCENNEVLIESGDTAAAPSPAAVNSPAGPASTTLLTESAGFFLAAHPMRNKPWVSVGDTVKKNDVLGLLKIGQIYAPITAPADGVITQILASDGALLGFGAPVLEMTP